MLGHMRFGRIATPEGMTFAVIDNEGETAKAIAGTPFTEPEYTGKKYALDDVRLLAPTLPSKVVAVGRNYACLLYTSPSPRDGLLSRMPSSA